MTSRELLEELKTSYSQLVIYDDKNAMLPVDIDTEFHINAERPVKEWKFWNKKDKAEIATLALTELMKTTRQDLAEIWHDIKERSGTKKEEPAKDPIDNLGDSGFDVPSCPDKQDPEEEPEGNDIVPPEKLSKMKNELANDLANPDDLEEKARLEREENERKLAEAEANGYKNGGYQAAKKSNLPAKTKPSNPQALAKIAAQYKYTETQIQAIKDTVAKGASDSEFEMLMYLANRYQLDPILKEIFYSSNLQTIMTSRDGYLKIAHRDKAFRGIQSMAVCENDDFDFDAVNCKLSHKFGKGDRGKVIGAWAIVKKEGFDPVLAYAPYDEHVQQGSKAWKYKSAMCCKCAESFALKRQFCITGLVTHEEFGIENVEVIDAEFVEAE
jgi:hypothetical protein